MPGNWDPTQHLTAAGQVEWPKGPYAIGAFNPPVGRRLGCAGI